MVWLWRSCISLGETESGWFGHGAAAAVSGWGEIESGWFGHGAAAAVSGLGEIESGWLWYMEKPNQVWRN